MEQNHIILLTGITVSITVICTFIMQEVSQSKDHIKLVENKEAIRII